MPIAKFVKCVNSEEGTELQTIIEAARYDISPAPGGYTVTCHQKLTSDGPAVEYRVNGHELGYDHCYIENAAGKTVQHVRRERRPVIDDSEGSDG